MAYRVELKIRGFRKAWVGVDDAGEFLLKNIYTTVNTAPTLSGEDIEKLKRSLNLKGYNDLYELNLHIV